MLCPRTRSTHIPHSLRELLLFLLHPSSVLLDTGASRDHRVVAVPGILCLEALHPFELLLDLPHSFLYGIIVHLLRDVLVVCDLGAALREHTSDCRLAHRQTARNTLTCHINWLFTLYHDAVALIVSH